MNSLTLLQAQPTTAWTQSWSSLFPLLTQWPHQAVAVGACYAVTLMLSGTLIRWVGLMDSAPDAEAADAGQVIGKCENLLGITLVLLGSYESLGLVLAAKSISRLELAKERPSYYLGGTLVNLTWTVFMGMVARFLVVGG